MKQSYIDQKDTMRRLTKARTELLMKEPFYGSLLMRLEFVLEPCGTACTDMKSIFWDPDYVEQLSDDDILFVLKHEVLHCVLQHCSRVKNRRPVLYNIAADVVVNSIILHSLDTKDYYFPGEDRPVPHLAPDGREGRDCTVEEIYDMLFSALRDWTDDVQMLDALLAHYYGTGVDSHDRWAAIPPDSLYPSIWEAALRDELSHYGNEGIPQKVRNWLKRQDSVSVNWKEILNDFIQLSIDHMDYTFQPVDRRFTEADFFLPSFHQTELPGNLWFLADISGSISDEQFDTCYAANSFRRRLQVCGKLISAHLLCIGMLCIPWLSCCIGRKACQGRD